MKSLAPLLLLVLSACAHSPAKKEYRWVSLSQKGFTANSLQVLKEDPTFQSHGGFENLKQQKTPLTEKKTDTLRKIVLVGDTGCRLKESKYGDSYQNCKDGKEWPYAQVMEKVTAENPDLIIHLGDYHYREDCSEGKICRNFTDSVGYGWRSWEADFFAPAQKALATAPWLFLRGNHEDCKRAFAGYQLLSEQTGSAACVEHEKTEYIQLRDLLLVNLDTASVSDRPETPENEAFWEKQFKDIETEIDRRGAKQVWLLTHKPLTAVVENRQTGDLDVTNQTLQKAFAKTGLRHKIQRLFAGHIHNTQLVQVENFPQQIVVGHSGTSLDASNSLKDQKKVLGLRFSGTKIKSFFTDTSSSQSFGYAVMTKSATNDEWQMVFK